MEAYITLHSYSQLWIYSYSHRKFTYAPDIDETVRRERDSKNSYRFREEWQRKLFKSWEECMEQSIAMGLGLRSSVSDNSLLITFLPYLILFRRLLWWID